MIFKALFSVCFLAFLVNARYEATWDSVDKRPIPAWFDEAKIGIFIHWGLYSVPAYGSEWFWKYLSDGNKNYVDYVHKNYGANFTYEQFAPLFTAKHYDPNKWADLFHASGAKYVVLTSKHHEGYCLWPTKYSPKWNVMDVGPHRDLLGDLAKAVRSKPDLRFGVYHSLFEWHHPMYLKDKASGFKTQEFVNKKEYPELIELVTEYKPDVIFSDGEWEAPDTYWRSTEFFAWLYNDSPVKDTVAINDRWGKGLGTTHEWIHGGYHSGPDRFNPGKVQSHKWESPMTIDKKSWGYRKDASPSDYLTVHELIVKLVEAVSCGGNILMNIGPTADGIIVPAFEERLRSLGHWLGINGEAIYKTTPWTHQKDTVTKDVWYTHNNKNVFAIVLDWPQNNHLTLGAVKQAKSVELLGFNGKLDHKSAGNGIEVTFPQLPSNTTLQWAWALRITE